MRLLRQQESTPFFTAEEGRKRRFFQNFPCRLHRLVLQFSCLRIWAKDSSFYYSPYYVILIKFFLMLVRVIK